MNYTPARHPAALERVCRGLGGNARNYTTGLYAIAVALLQFAKLVGWRKNAGKNRWTSADCYLGRRDWCQYSVCAEHGVADFYRVWEAMKCLAAAKGEIMEQVLSATAMYHTAQEKYHEALDTVE